MDNSIMCIHVSPDNHMLAISDERNVSQEFAILVDFDSGLFTIRHWENLPMFQVRRTDFLPSNNMEEQQFLQMKSKVI